MSVAYDYFPGEVLPEWDAPEAPVRDSGQLASVSVLHAPGEFGSTHGLRLTRRGQVVVALVVALLGGALLWLAAASAPAASAQVRGPAVVTVVSGDTLWSIAARVAPGGDTRAVVARLQQRNHLSDVDLTPGQVLHIR